MPRSPEYRWLGECRDYRATWAAMRRYTVCRNPETPDAYWALTHPPVFTQGLAGRTEHLLNPGPIPVIPTDRGGQVTYHGPGQLVIYTLIDLNRAGLGPRDWVQRLERTVIDWLGRRGVTAEGRPDAPGVYVDDAKIAALGLKIRQGRCYHGLSFNIDMDLAPFARINPCGYQGLAVTDVKRLLGESEPLPAVADELIADLAIPNTPNP